MRRCSSAKRWVLGVALGLSCGDDKGSDSNATKTTADATGATATDTTATDTTATDTTATDTTSTDATATDTTATDTTETDGTSTGVGPPPGCECIVDQPGGDPGDPLLPTCGETTCPSVTATCQASCDDSPFVVNADDVTCALMALRDRTPGLLQWRQEESLGLPAHQGGYILIADDGRAIRRSWGTSNGFKYVVGDARLGALRPPGEYDACLALVDDRARFQCIGLALSMVDELCDQGWEWCVGECN